MGREHGSLADPGGAPPSEAAACRDGRAELSPYFSDHGASVSEVTMIPQLTRHKIQVLLEAGHSRAETSRLAKVSRRTVRRVAEEPGIEHVDDDQERARRKIGRPSTAEPFRALVEKLLQDEPQMLSVEVLRRARLDGYEGGKSALYALAASLRPRHVKLVMRFEGLPGEFSQHDFGQVKITFLDGSCRIVHFFASRLKWSRWVEVTLVENEVVETLVRELADHFTRFEGVPLCAVFDRPKTVALSWRKDGEVTEWNPTFAYAALELGFTAEVCWPHQPQQKGAVENLVGWVKGSFFKQRRFHDMEDLAAQLLAWLQEVNTQRPSRATDQIPLSRMGEERKRLRPLKIPASELALRIPIQVGPTADVFYDGRGYAMPPEAAGLPGTLYLYRNRVKIVAGRWQAEHERFIAKGQIARLPEHRAAHLAAVAGKRGKRYLKRQQLFECGQATVEVLTEIVHRSPRGWYPEIDQLHELLQVVGSEKMERACRAAVQAGSYAVVFIAQCLGGPQGLARTAARVSA
jgi:transposase